MCRYHSTVKIHIDLVKIPVKWQNNNQYKCFLVWGIVLWHDAHRRYVWWIMIQTEFQAVHLRSPIWIINHHTYLLYTSCHRIPHTRILNFQHFTAITLLPLNQNSNQNYVKFKCRVMAKHKYRVIKNDCRGFNNLSYTIHLR
jgi:hypothetical protein